MSGIPVPGFPRYTVHPDGSIIGSRGPMSLARRPDGYLIVTLSHKGKKSTFRVHRLVAQAYIPNPKEKPEVNHIDCDRSNNAAENLEWVSSSENKIHSYRFGSKEAPWRGCRGYENPFAQEVTMIAPDGSRRNFGSVRLAAEFLGKGHGSISRAARGIQKTAYGFRWEYPETIAEAI